jgi:quercetin dioxygenase-like cupin family protein
MSGDNLMFFLVKVRKSGRVPEHAHPQEQMGICLSGIAEFISGNQREIVEAGTVYWIGLTRCTPLGF